MENKKWDYVWAAGCSHTVEEFKPGLRSWASRIAKKLNIPCRNYSVGGGSNMRVCRLLEEQFILNKPNGNPLILIGCTEFHRCELFMVQQWLSFTVSSSVMPRNSIESTVHRYLKAIYGNPEFTQILALHNIFMLKGLTDYLSSNGYDYLLVPMFDYQKHKKIANSIFDDFNEFDQAYMPFCRTGPYVSIDEGFHYGNNAHEAWAEVVWEKVKKKFNVEI